MNKKLIAVAVAAAFAAPVAMADVEVYGKAHVSAGQLDDSGDNGNRASMEKNNSNFGFRGSEDLGNGLKAMYQIELGYDASGNTKNMVDGSSSHGLRDTYVGLGGDWGKVLLGRMNTPYKTSTNAMDPFADTFADYNGVMGVGAEDIGHDARVNNAIAYASPDLNGFGIVAAYVLNDRIDEGSDQEPSAVSLSATYKQGPFSVAAAYQNLMEYAEDTPGDYVDATAMKIGGSYTFQENTTVNAIWENVDAGLDDSDRDAIYVSATHKIGATTVGVGYASAGKIGKTKDTGAQLLQVGATHALSKATSVYLAYAQVSYDDALAAADEGDKLYGLNSHAFQAADGEDSAKGWMVGVIHNFSSK